MNAPYKPMITSEEEVETLIPKDTIRQEAEMIISKQKAEVPNINETINRVVNDVISQLRRRSVAKLKCLDETIGLTKLVRSTIIKGQGNNKESAEQTA